MDWRVFWYSRLPGAEVAPISVSLNDQIFQTEAGAKAFVLMLMEEGQPGLSVNVPDSGRVLKGKDLRAWLSVPEG